VMRQKCRSKCAVPSLQGVPPAIKIESRLGFAAFAVEAAAWNCEIARPLPA